MKPHRRSRPITIAEIALCAVAANPIGALLIAQDRHRRRPKKMQLGEQPLTYYPGLVADPACGAV